MDYDKLNKKDLKLLTDIFHEITDRVFNQLESN